MKKVLLSLYAVLIGMLAWAQPTSVPAPTGDDIVAIYGSQLNKPVGTGINFYDWGSGSVGQVISVDGNETYMIPNLKWFGSQFDQVDASNKQKLHLDIFPMEDMDLAIALITWNSATNGNWGERGVNNTLTGGQWNSIDIDMQSLVDRGGQFDKLYQIKFVQSVTNEATDPMASDGFANGDGTKTFYIGNIYLTGTRVIDTEPPVLFSAEATEVLGNQVTLAMKATDNNQPVSFVITDAANNKTYDAMGNSGEVVTLTVKGLNAETAYSWTVQAKDMAGNLSENTITVNFTTIEGFTLTAAPAVQHNTTLYDIFSIYCDEFEKSAPGAFFNTWNSAGEILSEVSVVEGDNIEKIQNFGYLGNEFTTTTDLRDYTMHIDLLATELTQIGLTPITQSGEASTLYNVTPGEWTSLDIPMSAWNTLDAQYTFQFKWDRGNSQSDLYIDNFYFYKQKENEEPPVNPDAQVLTADGHTISLVGYHYTGTENYELIITSQETMSGLGGSFWEINGVGGYDLRTTMTVSEDGKTITVTATSNQAPQLYTPLYVLMPGEVNFGMVNIDWIEISDPTTGINGIANDVTGSNVVYSIDGRIMQNGGDRLMTLPAGIYVVNGKKVVVK